MIISENSHSLSSCVWGQFMSSCLRTENGKAISPNSIKTAVKAQDMLEILNSAGRPGFESCCYDCFFELGKLFLLENHYFPFGKCWISIYWRPKVSIKPWSDMLLFPVSFLVNISKAKQECTNMCHNCAKPTKTKPQRTNSKGFHTKKKKNLSINVWPISFHVFFPLMKILLDWLHSPWDLSRAVFLN